MASPTNPLINVRARTQIVVQGRTRYMGEQFQMPIMQALGTMATSELEQVTDPTSPIWWMASAPGPMESYNLPGDPANQGSREGAIGPNNRGGTPGDQQTRQLQGWRIATSLLPQQYDDYRSPSTAGLSGPTGQWWQRGATGATSGAPAQPFPPQGPVAIGLPLPPGGRPPRFPRPFPPGPVRREERREDREDRRDDRRDDRDDRRGWEARGEDRREGRRERREERRESRRDRRDDDRREERREERHRR